jgi:thioredoxin-like negative regulator of GroEL
MNQQSGSHALLLISTQCPHCHVMQGLLQERYQDGRLAGLEVVNIDQSPESAQTYAVRSVPWLQLNDFEFDGVLTPTELDRWIEKTLDKDASTAYLEHLLLNGKLSSAIAWLERGKASIGDLLPLIVKEDVKINVRIGIGAVLENFEDSSALSKVISELAAMAVHHSPTIRADVCHYLMLTHAPDSINLIKKMLQDEDEHVREIARDSLAELRNEG